MMSNSSQSSISVAVLGCGNVGVAIAADLSAKGHIVTLIKTSDVPSSVYKKIHMNGNRVFIKEDGRYVLSSISRVTNDIREIDYADVIFVTVPSSYHETLIRSISDYLNMDQIVICICSYLSSLIFKKYCKNLPTIVETTGPYLEGRVEESLLDNEIVFRVGCRLSRSPLSIYQQEKSKEALAIIKTLYTGFSLDYTTLEAALLNPNMIIHTVGAIMSIPRIEHSHGNFCMYREALTHENPATLKVMIALDAEKKKVLSALGCKPVDIFEAGGFLGDPWKSFFKYSESSDRAISPTSVKSRYITEDVPQGLVLLESIAKRIGVDVPVTSSLITIASNALGCDFRKLGRTIESLQAEDIISNICHA